MSEVIIHRFIMHAMSAYNSWNWGTSYYYLAWNRTIILFSHEL